MLTLLLRRARVQFPLLAAIVAVVTVGATLLGVCALLLTVSQEQALDVGMARAEPAAVEVTAYVSGITGANGPSVAADTRTLVTRSMAPFKATGATRISTVTRPLVDHDSSGSPEVAYLSSVDGLTERSRLISGHWPRTDGSGLPEAAILESTARLLGLTPGSRVRLGAEAGFGAEAPALTVVVAAVIRPAADSGWDRDPLKAAGFDPAYLDGRPHAVRAYGPFVVSEGALFASGSTIDRLQVSAVPELSAATSKTLNTTATSLSHANADLAGILGDRVKLQRVASDLPYTLGLAQAQQAVTRSAVLVVVLLGTVLTAVALGLAGRLITGLRVEESALLSRLGASRRQLVAIAAVEAILLATVSAALAVPLSGLTHSALTHLPALTDAGLTNPIGVTGAQLAAVVLGALLLAAVLVVPVLRPDQDAAVASRGRLELLARSGLDLMLLVLAVVGWWQLRVQPTSETGADTVRVLAPVLCLLAGAAVAPRLLAPPLRLAERLAGRSRGLVLALAVLEAARRPRAIAAGLLLALAAATATFGVAFGATWGQSQQDQADARIGTDLAISLVGPAQLGDGSEIEAAVGGTVSPATDRGVVVGRWVGDGQVPRLIAVDTRNADALLRGRAPAGSSWAQVGKTLAPKQKVHGLPVSPAADQAPVLTGTATPGSELAVQTRLVLQDKHGVRSPCALEEIPLDGKPHRLRLCRVTDGVTLVGISMSFTNAEASASPWGEYTGTVTESHVSIDLRVPTTGAAAPADTWTTTTDPNGAERIGLGKVELSTDDKATIVATKAVINMPRLSPQEPAKLVTTAFTPAPVPIAMAQRMADALGIGAGAELSITGGGGPVSATLVEVVPDIPSAPGEVAMLADVDLMSRELIVTGVLEPAIDAWWVSEPEHPAAATGLGLGRVDTRAELGEQLRRGPLRVGLPAALILLVPAALLLGLVGTIMHVTSDVESRALEMARLRGLGLTRRSILSGLLTQHGVVLVLLLSAGSLVGAVASWAVGPLLIRSDLGAAPVPGALVSWPWAAEAGLIAGLLIGGTAVVAVVVAVQLRRADAAHLRVGA